MSGVTWLCLFHKHPKGVDSKTLRKKCINKEYLKPDPTGRVPDQCPCLDIYFGLLSDRSAKQLAWKRVRKKQAEVANKKGNKGNGSGNGHTNGSGNGHTNGSGNGHTNGSGKLKSRRGKSRKEKKLEKRAANRRENRIARHKTKSNLRTRK